MENGVIAKEKVNEKERQSRRKIECHGLQSSQVTLAWMMCVTVYVCKTSTQKERPRARSYSLVLYGSKREREMKKVDREKEKGKGGESVRMCVFAPISVSTCVCMFVCACVRARIRARPCVCLCVLPITSEIALKLPRFLKLRIMEFWLELPLYRIEVCVRAHAYVYTCMCVRACTHVCVYVCAWWRGGREGG